MNNERIKELRATVDVLKQECYSFNPLELERTPAKYNALDVAIRELEKVIVVLEQEPCEEQDIYVKAYKEGYDKGWSDGNFVGKNTESEASK